MTSVNITRAKAQLSALVDRAAAGEEIVLSRGGRPVARLMPLAERCRDSRACGAPRRSPEDLFLGPDDRDDPGANQDALTRCGKAGAGDACQPAPGPPPEPGQVAPLDEILNELAADREDR